MLELLAVMSRLRAECPWDQAQTPASLTRYAIEEAYEVEAAIQTGNIDHIRDELGDLLLQVVFQAQMHAEQGHFNFFDIAQTLSQKLIRRHPHVYGDDVAAQASDVSVLWEQVKQRERAAKGEQTSILNDVKHGSPLIQAQSLQKLAAKVGFDWPDVQGARDKLSEEIAELDEAIAAKDLTKIEDELGDSFFALVNVARKSGIQSESALLGTIAKFRRRFSFVEKQLKTHGISLEEADLATMDQLWDEAKRLERLPTQSTLDREQQ
ncbi:nucleoside triphosphate pyrophosphohydrolase [Aquirhabdus parva]|uniref:nucleoside triphosphate pyrophosphohydrolase n=1 Tax=Aquirhabdus parva TaxID=2283318 RepID=UPI001AE3CAFD|nr:nucleoside triphosphate pyrophosphohydrolase [Aquirhabdus parva]